MDNLDKYYNSDKTVLKVVLFSDTCFFCNWLGRLYCVTLRYD